LVDSCWKETEFDTESKLQNEPTPVSEIHFTPGTPFFFKTHIGFSFDHLNSCKTKQTGLIVRQD